MHASLAPYAAVHPYGFADLLSELASSRPDRPAVVDGGHRFTFRQLDERVGRLATILDGHGVGAGDRILWLGQNSFRVIEVFLAAARLGAIICPANWRASAAEAARTISDFDPKVIFWQDAEIGETNREARAGWPDDRIWIQHDGADDANGYEVLLASSPPRHGFGPLEAMTPLLAIYTAAFSGAPGAALLSHESLLLTAMLNIQGQRIDGDSVYLVSGPMFHIGVLMGALATFLSGGCCVFMARMDAEEVLSTVQRERVTHAYIPPPTIAQLRALNADGAYDVSSLFRTPDMMDWRMSLVMPHDAPLVSHPGGYGQTEIGGLVVLTWLSGVAAGRPSPFLRIRIADDDGRDVPQGEIGEILARGPLVMCGYWNRPEENARRVIDGWHRTNDLGRRLPDGSIEFVSPKTTMIKSALENIYPAEVEACLREHDGVADVCVIGVPDPVWAQNVKAVIVCRPGADRTAAAYIDHCRRRMASYKKPKIVEFVDRLPRNAHGQIDRAAVDAAHGGGGYPRMA